MDYDMLDRIKTVKHPGPATRTYNYGATTVAITNERNITHTYSYRAYGDPDKRELMSISVPEPGANVTITRNPIGRILTVAQGDKTRAYVYNAVGQVPAGNFLTSIIDPETDTTTFGRDQVGNMTSRSVNGTPTTGFIYDALNRLTQINYPGGLPTVIRSYYGDGLLKDVEYGTAALRHFEYDANKNLTLDRLTVDGRIYSLGHSYSGNDGRSTTTFPSGTVVSFNPNGFGRPRAATPFAGNIDFHPSGELKTVEYANGVTTSIALNNRLWPQQLASLRSTPPLVDLKHTYTYDGTGNVKSLETRVDDIVDGLNSMPDLQYDAIDRLVLANTTSGEARAFSYDGAGNLLSQTKGGQILNYGYDGSNRLASISNRPYQFAYDLYGNVVNNGTASTPMFTYNDALQMTCFRCGQTDPVNYAYDGLNMRVRTEKGGIKTYFMYGLDGQLLLEDTPTTSSWGSDLKEYVYLQGKLVGVKAITRVGTATTTSTGSISSLIGGNVTLTVNVSGSSPTGTVTFKEGGVPFGSPVTVTNGSASITLSSLSVGSHTITADYSGDANNAQSSTTFQVTIYNLSWLPAILQLLLDD
ncbi:MAG: hypothetical protein A3I02_02010 [Betaproteobacteria bacterium RIFCSPLOWO2_02_FULL_67_26]|nr:MAG: hypothetical protein A3I02_02010 [Betaproteobacteria bacterium RIFCSPLOWO2_02_FULL_67_26]